MPCPSFWIWLCSPILVVAIDQYVEDGGRVSTAVGRRPSEPDVQLQEPCRYSDWQDEGVLATMPPTMGNHQYRIYQGVGFHLEPKTGDCKEGHPAQPQDASPKKKGKYPKGKAAFGDQEKEDHQEA